MADLILRYLTLWREVRGETHLLIPTCERIVSQSLQHPRRPLSTSTRRPCHFIGLSCYGLSAIPSFDLMVFKDHVAKLKLITTQIMKGVFMLGLVVSLVVSWQGAIK